MTESAPAAPRPISDAAYYLLAAIVGALTGAIGSLFHLFVEQSQHWSRHLSVYVEPPLLYGLLALFSATMIIAAVALVRTFAPEAAGSGVQEIEGAMEGLREVRWKRILPVKFVGGVMALGAGLVGGREGPTIHMGASVAKAVGAGYVLTTREARGLLAAGGAAGLAAAFNAPLAAILFVIEETRRQFPYGLRTYSAVIIASVLSAIVTESITGTTPFMALDVPGMPLSLLPAFAVLGVVLGFVGVSFNWALVKGLDLSRKISLRASPYLVPLVVGLIIGPLLILRPEATGGGEALAVNLASHELPVTILAIIVVMRFVMTVASYSTGAPAGIFAPILALATAVSVFYGSALALVLPMPPGAVAAFGVAGMAGLFSSTIRAPLVGMVLVAELTGAYSLVVPTILTAVFANLVADALGGEPIYEVLLNRTLRLAGVTPPPPEKDANLGGWDERERRDS